MVTLHYYISAYHILRFVEVWWRYNYTYTHFVKVWWRHMIQNTYAFCFYFSFLFQIWGSVSTLQNNRVRNKKSDNDNFRGLFTKRVPLGILACLKGVKKHKSRVKNVKLKQNIRKCKFYGFLIIILYFFFIFWLCIFFIDIWNTYIHY